jgi:hypothetical protein
MRKILNEMQAHSSAWPFKIPVDREILPEYYTTITHPMGAPCLSAHVMRPADRAPITRRLHSAA